MMQRICSLVGVMALVLVEYSSAWRVEAALRGIAIFMGICIGTAWLRGVECRVLARGGLQGGS